MLSVINQSVARTIAEDRRRKAIAAAQPGPPQHPPPRVRRIAARMRRVSV